MAQSARSVQSVAAQSAAFARPIRIAEPRREVVQCNGRWPTGRMGGKGKAASRVIPDVRHSFQRHREIPIQKPNAKSPIVVVARFGNYRFNASGCWRQHCAWWQRRWLTHRSTGPIAACRHLGYKSLAQMPAHRNGPVSSNVRPHSQHHRRSSSEFKKRGDT